MQTRARRMRMHRALCAAAIAGAALPSLAQQGQLEEVVVTAQKREQSIQDVPISMTAVGGEALRMRSIEGIANLNGIAPNVSFRESPGTTMISIVAIRGAVAGNPAIWMDPPVGMYIDGVYVGKSQGSVFDVVELERVEVLRGPQGTLFGRNTAGGAINFITRKPSGEFGGNVGLEYGRFDHSIARASLDLPQWGKLSTSLGYRKEDRDEIIENDTPGVDGWGSKDQQAWRFAATLDITEDLQAFYHYDHSEADNTPRATTVASVSGWQGPGAFYQGYKSFIETNRPWSIATNRDRPIFEESEVDGHALTLAWDVDENNQLKYIGAWREMDYVDGGDLDGTPIDFTTVPSGPNMYFQRHTNVETRSHELQWVGDFERLKYVLGYYLYEDDGYTVGPQDFFGRPSRSDYGSETDANAWFVQLDYELTDALTATVGFRQTEEKKTGATHRFNTTGFNGPQRGPDVINVSGYDAQWSADTPVFALNYALTNELNLYARVAKGFKSGGFSSELADPVLVLQPFDPEEAWTWEGGVKASFLDNRATLSAAVFRNEISDLHTTQLVPGTSSNFVTNAGEATYDGLELEGTILVAEGWTVQFSYGYLDGEFGEFMDYPIDRNPVTGQYFTNTAAGLIDTGSNRVAPYAPEHTLNLNLDGELARTEFGTLRMIVDYTFTSEMYVYAANESLDDPRAGGQYLASIGQIPDTPNLNARLLLAEIPVGGSGEAEVSIYGRNLTDFDDRTPSIDFGGFVNANWPTPRTYGMAVSYRW